MIEEKNLLKEGAIVVADNVIIYENERLEYVRKSGRYESQTTETTLAKNVKDALEISFRLGK